MQRKKGNVDSKGLKKLGIHEISLRHYGEKRTQICFNNATTSDIMGKELYKVFINHDTINKRLFLVFTKQEGYGVHITGAKKSTLTITSWKISQEILKFFGVPGMETYRIHISNNLSKNDSCYTVQLLKCNRLDDLRGDRLKKIFKAEDTPFIEDTPPSSEKDSSSEPGVDICIKVLKDHGYKILKPKITYEEI